MPFPIISMIGILAAGTVAAGVSSKAYKAYKANSATRRGIRAYRSLNTAYIPAGIRNPINSYITDDQIRERGNFRSRPMMRRNAKNRMNNLFSYKASVWDLEGLIK